MGIITILWEKWVEFRRDFYKITLAAMIVNRVSEQKTTPVAPAMQSFVPMGNLPTNNIVNMQPKKKIYPNDPCPCGSGKKYKKCCGRNK